MALELALRVDNMEASVPQLYRRLSSPSTIGSRPDPARRAGKMHDSERGPQARKAGHHPTGGAPSKGPPGEDGAPLGVHESSPRDTSTPLTRTGYLPNDLALSLMPQLHDAMEQEPGGESFGTASVPTGPAPAHGRPGADTTFPELPDSTPKAYRLGPETTTHRQLLPVNAQGHDPMHGTTTRKGAGPRRRVFSPRRCSGGTLLDSTLIPRSSLSE